MAQIRERKQGIFSISIYLGRDKATGKKTYHNETFRGTKKGAEKKAKELEQRYKGLTPTDMTLADYLDYWLTTKVDIEDSTLRRYKNMVEKIKKTPTAPYKKLRTLKVMDIQILFGEIKGLNPSSLSQGKTVLSMAFKQAEIWELIDRNPTIGVKLPKLSPKKPVVLNPEQFQKLLDTCKCFKHGLVIYILAETGLRIGEALGLIWTDINFKKGIISVNQTLDTVENTLKTKTKNLSSIRSIQVSKELIKLLLGHKKTQVQYLKGNNLVFISDNGKPLYYKYVYRTLKNIIKRANLPEISPHGLRHTAGSLLLDAGCSLASVAEFLGHANTTTTSQIYTHAVKKAVSVSQTLNSTGRQEAGKTTY